ncbi:MAG: hypothetical protein ABSD61_11710 [Terracidiphilus sp.]|jgi:hypothetical protein
MNQGLSNQVRAVAKAKYVEPALRSGKKEFSIHVREIREDLATQGFPISHVPQICSALRTSRFLRENSLEIESIEGPPSKTSPTVVFHYRVANPRPESSARTTFSGAIQTEESGETPDQWALRVTDKIRGLLKNEIAEMGGADGFIRWVRSDDEDEAA